MTSISEGRPSEPMSPAYIFFGFRGRIDRRTWWLYGVLALIGLAVLFSALLRIAGASEDGADLVVNLLLLWPAIAVSVKRWHDIDQSGWWVLINLIPVIGQLWALVANGFVGGTAGANRFGEPPIDD